MTSLYLVAFFAMLFAWKKSRNFAVSFFPWLIYAVVYDSMRFYPNYMVNPIDTGGLYDLEKQLFGIRLDNAEQIMAAAKACKGSGEAIWESGLVIPCEWFAFNHNALADFMAGCFYLCWIPVPAFFAIWLFFSGKKEWASRFSWAFLIVNLIGFAGYYIHPASPPWYVINYGFDAVLGTPGNMAGLARWDEMTGIGIFNTIYGKNSNVFAAMPSMHAAYMLVATVYAAMSRRKWYVTALFAFICAGIWWTAVYSLHHYVLDVIMGVVAAIAGIAAFEGGRMMKQKWTERKN